MINNVPIEPYNWLYFENSTTQIPKPYDDKIIKIVVNTEPIEMNFLFLSCLIPNLNRIDVVSNIIKIMKVYRPRMISGMRSLSTS
jgi:hypothetical protein